MSTRSALIVTALLAAGCSTTAPAPAPDTELSHALRWARGAAEHRALYLQTFELAGDRVEELARGREDGSWAVVVDADETILDNTPYQVERERAGLDYDLESWREWVRRADARPLPGAARFLERVRDLGGRIAVVTNRDEEVCADTRRNLEAEDLPYDVVLCQPAAGRRDKPFRFDMVESGVASPKLPPLEIVAWVGDNIHDFPGGSQGWATAPERELRPFGDRWFVLPNPMYGSWDE